MIVKFCKKHGDLTLEQARPHISSVNGKTYYDCKLCGREQAINWVKNNPDKVKARKAAAYVSTRKKLPDGFVKKCIYHGLLTLDQVKTPGENGTKHECLQCRKRNETQSNAKRIKATEELSDEYVVKLLWETGRKKSEKRKNILSIADFKKFPALIELKRTAVLIKRKLKADQELVNIGPKQPPTFQHSKENVKKAIVASVISRRSKIHCKKGHLLNEKRKCKICNTETKRRLEGHLPREIAVKTLVDTVCSKCGACMKVVKTGKRKDQRCAGCAHEYMRKYDASRDKDKRCIQRRENYLKRKERIKSEQH